LKIRIARYLAQQGICSRRDAERRILQGEIQVNGHVINSPAVFVDDSDKICVQGFSFSPSAVKTRLWLYYKPAGEITTNNDPQGRRTVFDSLSHLGLPRVVSVGRLDLNSEGLLLLTTNCSLAHELEKPSLQWQRHYKVRAYGNQDALDSVEKIELSPQHVRLENVTLQGFHYAPIEIFFSSLTRAKESSKNFWCHVLLTEGKNREIRKIMGHIGWQVNRLIRIEYGPFSLGDLKKGQIQEIDENDLQNLIKDNAILKMYS
jgi:23S rRNA pseudouridine2605 synthase